MAKNKSKKRRKLLIFSIMIAVLAGLTVTAVIKKKEVVLAVEAEKVARRDITEIVLADGRIQPVVQVKISPEVSGEIIALPVKEGQHVQKGDLLLQIKPDFYEASVQRAEASLQQAMAAREVSRAEQVKAALEFQRINTMFEENVISEADFEAARTARDVAVSRTSQSDHQVAMAKASLASAQEDLSKTTIRSPLTGTISKLNSELGERVLGTAQNMGTEIMVIADLDEMEARVEIGEVDIVLIKPNQIARLEVDAFRDREFTGRVTEIGNSALTRNAGSQQQATKFEVKIKINEKEAFRPGMSISADIETRYRTNVLSVPIQSVTRRRLPKDAKNKDAADDEVESETTPASPEEEKAAPPEAGSTRKEKRKSKPGDEDTKAVEVVFLVKDGQAKIAPVTRGISDDEHVEITEGVQEGELVVTGSYKAIDRELEDGSPVTVKEKDSTEPKSDL